MPQFAITESAFYLLTSCSSLLPTHLSKTNPVPTLTFSAKSQRSALLTSPFPIPLSSVPSTLGFLLTSSKRLKSLSQEGKSSQPHFFLQLTTSFLFSRTKFELFAHLYLFYSLISHSLNHWNLNFELTTLMRLLLSKSPITSLVLSPKDITQFLSSDSPAT